MGRNCGGVAFDSGHMLGTVSASAPSTAAALFVKTRECLNRSKARENKHSWASAPPLTPLSVKADREQTATMPCNPPIRRRICFSLRSEATLFFFPSWIK